MLTVVGLASLFVSRSQDGGRTVPLPTPATEAATGHNSADRVIFWARARECAAMTDAHIETWRSWGIDGFICWNTALSGATNGSEKAAEWTGDARADISGPQYQLQRSLRDSPLLRRARAGQLKLYLGFYTINFRNPATHLSEWFDDAGWSTLTLPKVRDIAGAARLLGFQGIALDQESYPRAGTWNWDYPGNTHREAVVRAKARDRGRDLMRGIVSEFPGVEIVAYGSKFPRTWDAVVQDAYRGPTFEKSVQPEFWDGMAGVHGYEALRFTGELFYKSPFPTESWDVALRYAQNSLQAYLSQSWRSWDYASTRVFQSPAAWIDAGDGRPAQPPAYVAEQLRKFRTWGDGREFYVFAFNLLARFDYRPFVEGIREASKPGVVDDRPPALRPEQVPAQVSTRTLDLVGEAEDDLAVRRVVWSNDRGGGGLARMTWRPSSERVAWSIEGVPLQRGVNTITVRVEDTKGLVTTGTVVVDARAER